MVKLSLIFSFTSIPNNCAGRRFSCCVHIPVSLFASKKPFLLTEAGGRGAVCQSAALLLLRLRSQEASRFTSQMFKHFLHSIIFVCISILFFFFKFSIKMKNVHASNGVPENMLKSCSLPGFLDPHEAWPFRMSSMGHHH